MLLSLCALAKRNYSVTGPFNFVINLKGHATGVIVHKVMNNCDDSDTDTLLRVMQF